MLYAQEFFIAVAIIKSLAVLWLGVIFGGTMYLKAPF